MLYKIMTVTAVSETNMLQNISKSGEGGHLHLNRVN